MTDDTRGSRQAVNLTSQVLRECAERIRLRCDDQSCTECPDDAAMLERIAQDWEAVTRQPQEEKGWQPIDSAPKDEDVLLLYLDGSGVQPGYWEDGQWLACETSSLTGGRWHAHPTHWQPLPDPPVGGDTPRSET